MSHQIVRAIFLKGIEIKTFQAFAKNWNFSRRLGDTFLTNQHGSIENVFTALLINFGYSLGYCSQDSLSFRRSTLASATSGRQHGCVPISLRST